MITKTSYLKNNELVVSSIVILGCLIFSSIFPIDSNNLLQVFTRDLFFLVLIPVFYIKIILKEELSEYGLTLGNKTKGLLGASIALVVLALVYLILLSFTSLQTKYHLPEYLAVSFRLFLFYELVLMNFFFLVQEFFWRGFVLFTFSKKYAYWAIIIQLALVILMSFINQTFFWQFSLPIALAAVSGAVAFRSRSIIYSYLVSILSIIILNAYIIHNINK